MRAATWPRDDRGATRLLWIDSAGGRLVDSTVARLPELLRAGDLLVVNDAATLPASLPARTASGEVEVRLAEPPLDGTAWAVLFGKGDWRQRTEDRPPPPLLAPGSRVEIGDGLRAEVREVSPHSPRLVRLSFDARGSALWGGLYREGAPVQYSYLRAALPLWHVQTTYRGRPWAVEMPSAGRPLEASLLAGLRARGVGLARLTHAAGLSSTGDPALDARLPLPERYDIPMETAEAVRATRARGRRVVAVGTTVVRALESAAAATGEVTAGRGLAVLRLGPGSGLSVVSGLLTGVHEPHTSHFALLGAFAEAELLARAGRHAEEAGYLGHEFGDLTLVLAA